MLNDTQRAVFRGLADNKPLFEALKELLVERFEAKIDPTGLTDQELGSLARAQFAGLKKVLDTFNEIASCKSVEKAEATYNPAR